MSDLYKVIEQKLINTINPPKNEVKRPYNRLWIALIAFNLIFFPLDIATGVSVGMATIWFYGLWVFVAGFGTMVIHEALFSNPYAKIHQKVISVVGFLTSIAITLVIGVAAIYFNLAPSGIDRHYLGLGMSAVSFVAVFGHGILIAVYYFSDSGFLSKMRQTSALAESDRMVSEVAMAQVLATAIDNLKDTLVKDIKTRGGSASVGAALNRVTGGDWELPGDYTGTQPGYTIKNNGNHPEPVREQANPTPGRER